jgi:RHS repeat-associated protein
LEVTYCDAQTTNYFAAYDGNGNVCALVNAADGKLIGQFHYGPFGEVIRATGPMAKGNPFRFSTKYQDDETDLLYYGYRYYSSNIGRSLSRDPIKESGGANLYALSNGDLLNHVDALGLQCVGCGFTERAVAAAAAPSQDRCQGTLMFSTVPPELIGDEQKLKRECPDNPGGCSYSDDTHKLRCRKCANCSWNIVPRIKAKCKIFLADPSKLPIAFYPDVAGAITHEHCHCDDWAAAYEKLITELQSRSYSNKSECQSALRKFDFTARMKQLIEPSITHQDPKYQPGGACYATYSYTK